MGGNCISNQTLGFKDHNNFFQFTFSSNGLDERARLQSLELKL